MDWCVPSQCFWDYRDRLRVFYERAWIKIEPERRRDYMRIYGVLR